MKSNSVIYKSAVLFPIVIHIHPVFSKICVFFGVTYNDLSTPVSFLICRITQAIARKNILFNYIVCFIKIKHYIIS